MANPIGQFEVSIQPSGNVRLTMADNPTCWGRLLVALYEKAENVRTFGECAAELPWWEFAALMRQINIVLKSNGDPVVKADAKTLEYINRAREGSQILKSRDAIIPIKENDLVDCLTLLGFGSGVTPPRTLNSEQKRNVQKLAALPSGATFSVPGAGKTTEALALYAYKSKLKHQLLVVCPKNAFPAWEEQVQICIPKHNVVRLVGGTTAIEAMLKNKPKIAIISYSQAVRVQGLIAQFLSQNPTVMFLDESHKIKRGEQGAWGSTVLNLSHLPEWKLIMSGTPMPNEFEDLEPQLRFLYPLEQLDFSQPEQTIPLLSRIYVRTTKKELNLPPVTCTATPLPMTVAQQHIYKLCADRLARDIENGLISRDKNELRRIGRGYMLLLQLSSNPALLARHAHCFASNYLAECLASDSPKIAYACMKARRLANANQKCIIWSGFVENVKIIAERLADLGADYIDGGVVSGDESEDGTRENKIAKFHNDPAAMVLVANPAACSEGISLHQICHYALYVDRNYNAAQFLQSSDRIHRLGLKPGTRTDIEIIYHRNTIDDSVNRRLTAKVRDMETTLNDFSIGVEPLWQDLDDVMDEEDIKDLLLRLVY